MTEDSIEETIRNEGGRVLATLIRLTGDFATAEDAVQEAVEVALRTWPRDGVPINPGAWLTTTAKRKALDRIRRESRRQDKEREAVLMAFDDTDTGDTDLLRLIFTCCHPALSRSTQVPLALRTLCGLSTGDIARAFLVPEPTIGQRISRAKKKIATAGIPYRVPDDHELPDRLEAVMAVIYLVFTTGHHAPTGAAGSRVDLAAEAIRLGRMLQRLMPDEGEVMGLLALMLSTHARRDARSGSDGSQILLADQDRSRWDREAIREASQLVESSLRRGGHGAYRLQGAIATLHGLAPSWEDTDWPQIVELYRMLEQIQPTPVVRVNRAVAESRLAGPEAGLVLLDGLDGVDDWHLHWSVRSELLREAGRSAEAAEALERALACDMNDSDRSLLQERLIRLV